MKKRKESYEHEPQESIDYCLSCTLPASACTGHGKCPAKLAKRRHGQLEAEVNQLLSDGLQPLQIATRLGISKSSVYYTIYRLRDKQMINQNSKYGRIGYAALR